MQFEEFVHEVLAAGARPTSHVPAPSTDRLREVLADARRSGLAVPHAPDGPLVVAAPVCGPSGTVVAALALTVPDGIEPRSVAPVVRATAQRISRELAGSPAGVTTCVYHPVRTALEPTGRRNESRRSRSDSPPSR